MARSSAGELQRSLARHTTDNSHTFAPNRWLGEVRRPASAPGAAKLVSPPPAPFAAYSPDLNAISAPFIHRLNARSRPAPFSGARARRVQAAAASTPDAAAPQEGGQPQQQQQRQRRAPRQVTVQLASLQPGQELEGTVVGGGVRRNGLCLRRPAGTTCALLAPPGTAPAVPFPPHPGTRHDVPRPALPSQPALPPPVQD